MTKNLKIIKVYLLNAAEAAGLALSAAESVLSSYRLLDMQIQGR
ncbi:hypothetical protein [Acinetobacter tianfuensis]|nr:hypothetical protein [Acinetobacter tianfuensis]